MSQSVKEFASEITGLFYLSPKPISRNEGHVPTDFKISVVENDVTISWIQEVMSFGNTYYHIVSIVIRKSDEKWFVVNPISSKTEDRKTWFPSFVKYVRSGEEFDSKKFLKHFRGSKISFDWSKV